MAGSSGVFDLDRTIAELHEEAARRTGLRNFGPETYREPLAMLARHLGDEGYSEIGRDVFREDLILVLVGRLIREDAWARNPAYSQRTIDRPLVICGVPRTGTTALHKLLSVDPQFQGLDNWITSWPVPRPPRAEWPQVQGFRDAQARLERLFEQIPELRISHEMVADEVDECLQVLRLDFVSYFFPATYDVPDYFSWFQEQDETFAYRRLADTLRLVGLRDDRKWLLKNPGHLGQIDALLTAFPDARVIVTHRDPVKALPSLCSVLAGGRKLVFADPDLRQMGPREVDYWGRAKQAADDARTRFDASQFLDVDHRDFHRDPMGIVRQIYDQFELELDQAVATAMEQWLAANPAGKHGEHRYTLSDYGLDEARIRDALGKG
jgi:hypothetical protein